MRINVLFIFLMGITLFFSSCGENYIDLAETQNTENVTSTTITCYIPTDCFEGSKIGNVGSLIDDATINGDYYVLTVDNSNQLPQIIYATNPNGDITYMFRGRTYDKSIIQIDSKSTTTALILMHNAFWSITPSDYEKVVETIECVDGYDAVQNAVINLQKNSQDLFNESNTELLNALTAYYDNFCDYIIANGKGSQSSTINSMYSQLNNVNSRSTEEDEYSTWPIQTRIDPATVALRVAGLAPVYEVTSTAPNGKISNCGFVNPKNYSWTDFIDFIAQSAINAVNGYGSNSFSEAWLSTSYGDWLEVPLDIPGEYNITLDRTTPGAYTLQAICFLNDFLSIVGAKIDSDNLEKEDIEKIKEAFEPLWQEIVKQTVSQNIDPAEISEIILNMLPVMSETLIALGTNDVIEGTMETGLVKFTKGLAKGLALVNGVISGVCMAGRIYQQIITPTIIDLCFKRHNSLFITECDGKGIWIVSGNNQTGRYGEPLAQEIKMGAVLNQGQKVVVLCNDPTGHLSQSIFYPEVYQETPFYFSFEWTLGTDKTFPNQRLEAYIIDENNTQISRKIVVDANVELPTRLYSINFEGDPLQQIQYDALGRISSVEDNISDESWSFDYQNDTTLKLITLENDGDILTIQPFAFNNDGYLTEAALLDYEDGEIDHGSLSCVYKNGFLTKLTATYEGSEETWNITWDFYSDESARIKSVFYADKWEDDPDGDGGYNKYIYEKLQTTYTYGDLYFYMSSVPQYSYLTAPVYFAMMRSGFFGKAPTWFPHQMTHVITDEDNYSESMTIYTNYKFREDGYIDIEALTFGGETQRLQYGYNYPISSRSAPMPTNGIEMPFKRKKTLFSRHGK